MMTHALHSAETLPSERKHINALQMLRFAAAFLVFVGHAQHELVEMLGTAAGTWGFVPLDWGLGVDIFFVISGFVMYFLTADGFGVRGGAADFMRRRLVRIVPLYWFFSLLMLAALVFASRSGGLPLPSVPNIIFSFLFLPGPQCADYCFPIFSLGWTLNYEMLFYCIFAVGLCFPRRTGLTIIVGTILLLMILALFVPSSWTALRFWGYPITGEFLAGIGIAALYRKKFRIPVAPAILLMATGIILAIIFYQLHLYESVTRLITGGIPAALMVAATLFGLEPQRLGKMGRLLLLGGDSSYALYLWHPFGIKIGEAITHRLPIALSPLLFYMICAIVVLIGSVLLHRFAERPVTIRLNHAFRRRTPLAHDPGQPARGTAE